MRKVLIFCIITGVVLCMCPIILFLVTNNKAKASEIQNSNITPKTSDTQSITKEHIINEAIKYCKSDFCEEGLKAALALAENNLSYNTLNNISTISNTYYESNKLYNLLADLYESVDVDVSYNNQCVYIPISSLSKGHTVTSEKYPYMKSVASPWDCNSPDYIYGKEYPLGISMSGINYLCEEGMSYTEALRWYLPDFEINKSSS